MRRRVSSDGEFGLQIAPMLDILFVLLLFFMVMAEVQKQEALFVTHLPGGKSPLNDVQVRVGIDVDGQVDVNGATVDTTANGPLVETIGRLRAIVASNAHQPVVIIPQASTRQQRVVDVLDACLAAGAKNVAFGATP